MKSKLIVGLLFLVSYFGFTAIANADQYFYFGCQVNCGIYCGCGFGCGQDYKIWASNPYDAKNEADNSYVNYLMNRKGWSRETAWKRFNGCNEH